MDPRQKSVLLVGTFLVGLAVLFPPWVFVDQYIVRVGAGSEPLERLAGHRFYFLPPSPSLPPECAARLARYAHERATRERPLLGSGDEPHDDSRSACGLIGSVTRIDTRRLTIEWAAIVLVAAGLLLFLRSGAIPPQAPEPTRSPNVDPRSNEALKTSSLNGRRPAHVSANSPNEPAQSSQGSRRLLEFLVHANRQEFTAATAAILQGLTIKARERELAYHWITKHPHRFAKLLFVGGEPRNLVEAAIVRPAVHLIPEIEKHFSSINWATHRVTHIRHRVAAHWALAELLDEQVDLDPLAQEAVEQGLTSRMITDHDPLLFLLDREHPDLPPWLPEDWGPNGRQLTPVEKVEWFDELLRREYGTSNGWPPSDDIDTRRQEVVLCLYRMYIDLTNGALPKPSFVHDEERSESSTNGPMKR